MTRSAFPLRHFWRWSTRPFTRAESRSSEHNGTTAEILAACRQILRQPLDDDVTRRAVVEYWTESGAADYDKTWRGRLELIVRVIEDGEISLPRVLAEVARRVERKRHEALQASHCVALNEQVRLPHAGVGFLHRGLVARIVTDLCTPRTEAVLELGSGWGEHLSNVWLSGGPRDARYYACELSEAGRKCALVLGALDPSFQLRAPGFNYVAPQFRFLSRQQSVVAYSVHSVEQVHEVAPDLIHRLCALANDVKGAHVEPIGWQMIPRAQWNDVTTKHERRCRKKRYNQNLWPLLKRAEAEGLIAIDHAVPNVFGLEHNPASLVVWHKR